MPSPALLTLRPACGKIKHRIVKLFFNISEKLPKMRASADCGLNRFRPQGRAYTHLAKRRLPLPEARFRGR